MGLIGALALVVGCGEDTSAGDELPLDTAAFVPDIAGAEVIVVDTVGPPDAQPDVQTDTGGAPGPDGANPGCSGFGCPCQTANDCDSQLCIDGSDGRVCTRICSAECPDGFDCINTTAFGPDPLSLCVPRHVRVCRPCRDDVDCQDPADPFPAYCLPDADPARGSFCGSSCASRPCPTGMSCESVTLASGGVASQCVPANGGPCECRPSWSGLGFATTCLIENGFGACEGTRSCGEFGLTPCAGPQASAELCNGLDDDCDGATDNIPADACPIQNLFGTCEGVTVCGALGPICEGPTPAAETCDGIDNDCDGDTDEAGSCDDGLACTVDECAGAFDCRHTLQAGFCAINGACYVAGAVNPNNPCEACAPASSPSAWTQAANTCVINGQCYPNGAVNPNNACQICDVTQGTAAWTVAANTCTIGGQCYASGAINPASTCQICSPATSTTTWTQASDTCNIQGQCFAEGAVKPGEPCMRCRPSINPAGWSPAQANTICDDGSPCSTDDRCDSGGACVGDTSCNDGVACTLDVCTASGCDNSAVAPGTCRIGGVCYTSNTANPANVCQRCNPSQSATSWSPQPSSVACSDGNACTTGDACNGAGQCVGGPGCSDGLSCTTDVCDPAVGCSYPTASGKCKINDVCYDNGATQPGNVCFRCNASASQSSWSLNNGASCSDGNSCTNNDTCSGGVCSGTPQTDSYEPNNSSGAARYLGEIPDSHGWADSQAFSANLYPTNDEDWYRYRVTDPSNTRDPNPAVQLSGIPSGRNYQLCAYWSCDDPGDGQSVDCEKGTPSSNAGRPGCCSTNGGSSDETVRFKPDCPNGGTFSANDDAGTVYVRVYYASGGWTCSNYTLRWGDANCGAFDSAAQCP